MPTNFELKVKIDSLEKYENLAKSINASFSQILDQTDTYFKTGYGKLKLREFADKNSELIYYDKQEEYSQSDYIIAGIKDTKNLKKIFSFLFETIVVVKKRRVLYLFKNARIHLDTVEELGTFLEFEVVVSEGDKQARELLDQLYKHFNINEDDIVKCGYSELIINKFQV
jgi:predicted adenylyl cyclase CyaB